jgi:hypothetical protein
VAFEATGVLIAIHLEEARTRALSLWLERIVATLFDVHPTDSAVPTITAHECASCSGMEPFRAPERHDGNLEALTMLDLSTARGCYALCNSGKAGCPSFAIRLFHDLVGYCSNVNILFQSFFMLITVQPFFFAYPQVPG